MHVHPAGVRPYLDEVSVYLDEMSDRSKARFAAPWRRDGNVLQLTASELALFSEGCELVGRRAGCNP